LIFFHSEIWRVCKAEVAVRMSNEMSVPDLPEESGLDSAKLPTKSPLLEQKSPVALGDKR